MPTLTCSNIASHVNNQTPLVGVAPTLTSNGDGHTGYRDEHGLVLMDQGESVMNVSQEGLVGTLRSEAHGHEPIVMQAMAIRRLTPVECERLQGFPDEYTNIPYKGGACPDSPRYKALGNSWAVPVVRWIGERIARGIA